VFRNLGAVDYLLHSIEDQRHDLPRLVRLSSKDSERHSVSSGHPSAQAGIAGSRSLKVGKGLPRGL